MSSRLARCALAIVFVVTAQTTERRLGQQHDREVAGLTSAVDWITGWSFYDPFEPHSQPSLHCG